MLSLKNLNSALTGLSNRINFDTISNAAVSARDELSSTQTTRLGVTAGEVVGGFQSLTQEVDNGSTEVVGGGMSLMVGNPDGTQIIQDISSSNLTDLNAITGLTMSSGLNKTVVSGSTPTIAMDLACPPYALGLVPVADPLQSLQSAHCTRRPASLDAGHRTSRVGSTLSMSATTLKVR